MSLRKFNNIKRENIRGFGQLAGISDLNIINYGGGSCPMFQAYNLKADIFVYGTHKLTKIARKVLLEAFFTIMTRLLF